MKILVDECVTYKLLPHLASFDVTHITDTSLQSMKDNLMLPLAAPDFDVFLTTDRRIPFQNNLKRIDYGIRDYANRIERYRLPVAAYAFRDFSTS